MNQKNNYQQPKTIHCEKGKTVQKMNLGHKQTNSLLATSVVQKDQLSCLPCCTLIYSP